MRIYAENTENYIKLLAASISKDPASLENWRGLYLECNVEATLDWYRESLLQLREEHKDADCDVVLCADGDLIFISRELNNELLFLVADALIEKGEPQWQWKDVAFYDLFRDWRSVRELLLAKTGSAATSAVTSESLATQAASYNFGEISSLSEVFSEAKKLRKVRQPLHIMIVEDDPLTRRIVAGGFKENYALITAENAAEAVSNYLLHAPDIVFLDIGLPDTSGFEVLRQIIACDPDAYVVMFSGNSYLDNITASIAAGASGFIAKPFKKEKMRHYIEDSSLHHRNIA